MKYDDTFTHMKEADIAIFSVKKTHADKMNAKNNNFLEKSQQKMFQSKKANIVKSFLHHH